MKKILKPRKSGRTTELIKISAATWNYIVCQSLDECSRIASVATEMNLNIPFPISYGEFIRSEFNGKGIKGFLIDNADALLQQMAWAVPVNVITMTDENVNEPTEDISDAINQVHTKKQEYLDSTKDQRIITKPFWFK